MEALLLFAGTVLLVTLILTSMIDVSLFEKAKQRLDTKKNDEQLQQAFKQ